ncbi:hypothetical protein [Enterococcus sp. AZ072]|uniref:hypothetical protein n=1 Tax=unclassified Enterococcus TaxID=2608891 RepID=UPI003D288F14
MTAIHTGFLHIMRQLRNDSLLLIMLFVPFLAGTIFHFGLPVAESYLTNFFSVPVILAPYYQLVDVLLSLLTPTILSFVVALIILEEADDGIVRYLAITPLGKKGYLISRLGIMTLIAIPLNLFVTSYFSITELKPSIILAFSVFGAVHGLVVALMIVALSSNKVEGMAIGKVTSLITVGLFAPYFLSDQLSYLFAAMPSFWVAKFVIEGQILFLILSLTINVFFICLLFRRFAAKLR